MAITKIQLATSLPNVHEKAAVLLTVQAVPMVESEEKGTGPNRVRRECLITTGATAPFPELIHAALQPDCLQALKNEGYTHITFQVGASLDYWHENTPQNTFGLKLKAFAFHPDLKNDMRKCLDREGSIKGSVISAAGRLLNCQSHSTYWYGFRIRNDTGCHAVSTTTNCSAKPEPPGQPPEGVGWRACETRLRHQINCQVTYSKHYFVDGYRLY